MHANKKIPSFRNTRLIALSSVTLCNVFGTLFWFCVCHTLYDWVFSIRFLLSSFNHSMAIHKTYVTFLHKYSRQLTLVVSIPCESTLITLCKYSCIFDNNFKESAKDAGVNRMFSKITERFADSSTHRDENLPY